MNEKEKEVVREINHPHYTVEFLEEWIYRNDNVFVNAPAALEAMGAKGFYAAVEMLAKNRKTKEELREKLKKYEDICMYPEKLKEISGLFLEKCQEVNRLKADLEKQKSGWILCSERLPEVPEGIDDDECPEFNVVIKGASKATTLRCSSDGQWFDEFGHVYPVFFWQPLPEVFQEERISRNDTDQNNLITISPCENVNMTISVTDQMRKDYLECKAMAEITGDRKCCDSCSWDKLEVFGTGMCELPIITECI